jgi:uncharacterized protein (DUF2236 family)
MRSPRSAIAAPVREVLSGRRDGRSDIAKAIAQSQGEPGWFTPESDIWRVHGSVATFVGGIQSLLLQTLHPLALAGVNEHSSYRTDPFGRLQRTGAFIAATTFGSTELAQRTVMAVTTMHTRVRGTAADGRSYSASDPRLLLWVHITLTEAMLTAYLRYGRDGDINPDGYVADMAVVGRAMGVVDPPVTRAELEGCLTDFADDLAFGPDAERMKGFILKPPLPMALRPGYAVLAAGARNLMRAQHRELLRDPVPPPPVRTAQNVVVDATLRVLRASLVESPAKAAGERRLGRRD